MIKLDTSIRNMDASDWPVAIYGTISLSLSALECYTYASRFESSIIRPLPFSCIRYISIVSFALYCQRHPKIFHIHYQIVSIVSKYTFAVKSNSIVHITDHILRLKDSNIALFRVVSKSSYNKHRTLTIHVTVADPAALWFLHQML